MQPGEQPALNNRANGYAKSGELGTMVMKDQKAAERAAVWVALNDQMHRGGGSLPYTNYVNPWLARYVAIAAYRVGMTANQVSLVSFAISTSAIAAIFMLDSVGYIEAGLIVFGLLLGYVIDGADGALARATKTTSKQGEWLDHSLDALKICAIHSAILYSVMRSDADFRHFGTIWMFIIASATASFTSQLLREKLVPQSVANAVYANRRLILIRDIVFTPFDYGVFCFIFLLLPFPSLFVVVYMTWGVASVFKAGFSAIRSYRLLSIVR